MSTLAVRQGAVALLTLVAIVEATTGHDRPDDVSYRTGYTAVPNATYARALMAPAGTSPRSVCDTLLDRLLLTNDSTNLIEPDFVSGCTHAIADAME